MTTSPEAEPSRPTSGLALLDKPAGWTSHQVVGRIRRLAGTRKVGHAGTLDPMATGLLIIGVEKATRLLGYLALSDKMLGSVEEIDGLDEATRHKLKFAVKNFVDAMSPSNFAVTNPQVLKRTIETRGENLLKGLANMLKDIAAGQVTQSKPGAFEVGRNLATTPGKVIHETALYQLIQYTPTTD